MSRKSNNVNLECGWGGLRPPSEPKPVRVPEPFLESTDFDIGKLHIRTDSAGLPIQPKANWQRRKVNNQYHPDWRKQYILISGDPCNRLTAIPSLTEWLERHLYTDFDNFETALEGLKRVYFIENQAPFPEWAEIFLNNHHAENNLEANPQKNLATLNQG